MLYKKNILKKVFGVEGDNAIINYFYMKWNWYLWSKCIYYKCVSLITISSFKYKYFNFS